MKLSTALNSNVISTIIATLTLAGCNGGDGSGESKGESYPTAGISIDFRQARPNSAVAVSGRTSEELDGPIVNYTWRLDDSDTGFSCSESTNGLGGSVDETFTYQGIEILCTTRNSFRFVTPTMDESETTRILNWTLDVTDSQGDTDSDSASVTVHNIADLNNYLLSAKAIENRTIKVIATTVNKYTEDDGKDSNYKLTFKADYKVSSQSVDTYEIESSWNTTLGFGGTDEENYHQQHDFIIPDRDDVTNLTRDNRGLVADDLDTQTVRISIQANDSDITPVLILPDSSGAHIACSSQIQYENPTYCTLDESTGELIVNVEGYKNSVLNQESLYSAQHYYNKIDPAGKRTTFADWLQTNGFDTAAEGEVHNAKYINAFDLGFGRDMFVRRWIGEDGKRNVAAYVNNYPNLDSVVQGTNYIATVAMEYTCPEDEMGNCTTLTINGQEIDRHVKFYVFTQKGNQRVRVLTQDFDGRGEKTVPGTCLMCHGGNLSDLDSLTQIPNNIDCSLTSSNPENTKDHRGSALEFAYLCYGVIPSVATFIPWDLDTLDFSDEVFENKLAVESTSSDGHETTSKEGQAEAFRFFNQAVLDTLSENSSALHIVETDSAKLQARIDLIHGWYHEQDADGNIAGDFNGDYIPEDWQGDHEKLYTNVIAPTCRGCHLSLSHKENFNSVESLESVKSLVGTYIFQNGYMPAAKVTSDRFWLELATETTKTRKQLLEDFIVPTDLFPTPSLEISDSSAEYPSPLVLSLGNTNSIPLSEITWTYENSSSGEKTIPIHGKNNIQLQLDSKQLEVGTVYKVSVTATSPNFGDITTNSTFTVEPPNPNRFTLEPTSITINKGQSAKVELKYPEDITLGSVDWSLSDGRTFEETSRILQFDSDTINEGDYTLFAKFDVSHVGERYEATSSLNVVAPDNIILNPPTIKEITSYNFDDSAPLSLANLSTLLESYQPSNVKITYIGTNAYTDISPETVGVMNESLVGTGVEPLEDEPTDDAVYVKQSDSGIQVYLTRTEAKPSDLKVINEKAFEFYRWFQGEIKIEGSFKKQDGALTNFSATIKVIYDTDESLNFQNGKTVTTFLNGEEPDLVGSLTNSDLRCSQCHDDKRAPKLQGAIKSTNYTLTSTEDHNFSICLKDDSIRDRKVDNFLLDLIYPDGNSLFKQDGQEHKFGTNLDETDKNKIKYWLSVGAPINTGQPSGMQDYSCKPVTDN